MARFARCTVSGNASYGIYLLGATGQCNGNAVVACTVVGNDPYGVVLSGSGGRCEGNVVKDCVGGGQTELAGQKQVGKRMAPWRPAGGRSRGSG